MPKLLVSEHVYRVFVGGLITICRTNGRLAPLELRALRETVGALFDRSDIGELLLDSATTPGELATALDGGEMRPMTGTPREHIARSFLEAALTVAGAGDGLDVREGTTIRQFAAALGIDFDERG